MNRLLQDLGYALRQLRKSPGFTVVAVLTLALGIAASTAMFGVLNAVLLRPLPFPDSNRLVRVFSTSGNVVSGPSALDARDFAAQNRTFDQLVVYDAWRKNVSDIGRSAEPEQLVVGLVPAGYFDVLGIQPLMGRFFSAAENRWGSHYEVVLSYNFWQTRFRGDPSVLGKAVRINDEPYTIIGITQRSAAEWWFDTPRGKVELWTPFAPSPTVWDEAGRAGRGFSAIGRVKPGASLAQAQADLQRIASNLAARYPQDSGVGVRVQPLEDDRVGNLRPVVQLLMGAVILILLIACSNVANLLLVRNSDRAREIAVRSALGAERSVLIRQFMTENLVLGLLAGGIGCALAWLACEMVAHAHPAKLPQLALVSLDLRVLTFALGISVVSSLFFGILPTWISSGVNLSDALKEGGRARTATRSRHFIRRLFVASEMAFAVMLLIGAGLLGRSLLLLQNQQPGFRVDYLLRTHLFLPAVRYPDAVSITRFSDDYAARVRQSPGVLDATISAAYPPDDEWIQNFTIENRPESRLENRPSATFNVTDPHYLHTLGIPLLRGRDFADSDSEASVPVALVNQTFVSRYFPHEDPLGKQIRLDLQESSAAPVSRDSRFTIIGVIGDAMNRGLALPPDPQITTLYRQTPDLNYGFKNLIVRTALDPLQLAQPIRQQLQSLDPNLPFAEVSSMDEIMEKQTADRRYTTGLLVLFACCGGILAMIGVYGVVSQVVAQRTSEIGLRMALGAQRSDVLWLIIKQGTGVAVAGAVAGLLGAWILRQTVAQLVFGISPADPATFCLAALLLIAFAVAASLVPARRAAKVDPIAALRYE